MDFVYLTMHVTARESLMSQHQLRRFGLPVEDTTAFRWVAEGRVTKMLG